jgi:hypothetical protein
MRRLADGQETNDDLLAMNEELRSFMVEGIIGGEGILWGGWGEQVSDEASSLVIHGQAIINVLS